MVSAAKAGFTSGRCSAGLKSSSPLLNSGGSHRDSHSKVECARTAASRTVSLYRYEPKRQIDGVAGIFEPRGGVQCPSVLELQQL